MKKKLLIKRIFSIIVAVALLVSAVPISLAVQNMFFEETTAKIVREVTELREESVKHFLCEDGSYIAATYSAPVHYKENGEWKEFDNSLSLDRTTLSNSGKPTYTTKAGGLSVSVPQNFSDGQKITAKNKGYEIGFSLSPNQKDVSLNTSASIVGFETLSSNSEVINNSTIQNNKMVSNSSTSENEEIESYNAEIMTVDIQPSAVTYKEILPNTDFEYIVTCNSIKENIVVYTPQNEYTYSFDVDFDGLTPIVNSNNSISLVEPNNPDETIFFIDAPYMYDSNNEESIDIDMSLVANGNGYVMTLVANAEWINATERVFPVVIDPTVYLSFNDVFVMDGLFNKNTTKIGKELRVGRNLTNLARTYIKPTIPTNIPSGSYIESAYLTLKEDYFYRGYAQKDILIYAYDCYDVNYWNPNSITWENQPYNNSENGYGSGHTRISSVYCGSSKPTYSFDIKSAVTRWLNGGVNNGIMLASSSESTKIQIDFHSSRASDTTNYPQMYITYIEPSVSISNWETDSQAKESSSITITTSKEWTAYTDSDWISLSETEGTGIGTIKISVTENTFAETRTGTVIVKIGNTVIGNITVTQLGADPCVLIDKPNLTLDYKADTIKINITANTTWQVSQSEEDWIEICDIDNSSITLSIPEYIKETDQTSSPGVRTSIITIKYGGKEEKITIKQLDEFSCYFNTIDSNNLISQTSSSSYYHPLATMAMDLSYKAYNPIPNLLGNVIPGLFMDTDETAKELLVNKGFNINNIEEINYESNDAAAHVVAYREIAYGNEGTKPLVVVIVRGSVTVKDWLMDFATQFTPQDSSCDTFVDGCDMVINSLYGSSTEEGYLDEKDLKDKEPLFLITGHSLGAAVANLVAAEMNSRNSMNNIENIYAYTFATPNVLNGASEENIKIEYANIFNILNTNDSMPFVPLNLLNPIYWNNNAWFRYGQDYYITMPMNVDLLILSHLETAWLGFGGHAMTTYTTWMENLPTILNEDSEEIDINDIQSISSDEPVATGPLPKFLKVKCPVSVSLYDSSGNMIAFESQEENTNNTFNANESTYSDGVVSWITEENEKIFFIPYGYESVESHIEAYDYGNMTLSVGTIGAIDSLESKTYKNVSLHPEKEFIAEISSDTPIEDTNLYVVEDNEIISEVTELDPPFKSISAEQTEVIYNTPIRFTIVTDNTVSEINLYNKRTENTMVLIPNEIYVNSVVPDGNNLIWTIGFYPNVPDIGENIYDISVKSNDVWHSYTNVIALRVMRSSS